MIIDLRDYTLKPNTRDQFVECCETVIFPEQERLGATILGMFRDAHRPNRVVWLRAMPDMAERQRILTAFYSHGEVWRAHHQRVNSWLVDSHNVLLVRPVADLATSTTEHSVVAMYTRLGQEPCTEVEEPDDVSPVISAARGRLLVKLATDPSENNYPRHPIRTGEFGFVWLAAFEPECYQPLGLSSVEERKLLPTERSRLR